MAYLNVRERRLETKIAYIGPPSSGKATNLERLGETRATDDGLALFWKPREQTTFRDCDVRVELVTARGADAERVRSLVRESDGVVFVADADRDAQAKNHEVLEALQAAMAAERVVPVVVQVNKRDLPEAVDVALGDWPHVEAVATRGEGVVETAERALEVVLESLRKRDLGKDASAAPPPAREGHPLLSALRQVLRETVEAHVDELERRLSTKVERSLALQEAAVAKMERLTDEVASFRAELLSLRETVGSSRAALQAVGDTAEQIAVASIRHARAQTDTLAAVTGIAAEVKALGASNGKGERDQQALLAATKRGIDALAAEVKNHDAKQALAALQTEVEALHREATELRTNLETVKNIAPKLSEIEAGLIRHVTGLAKRLELLGASTEQVHGDLGQRSAAVQALVESLIEELKKPKKGWFS